MHRRSRDPRGAELTGGSDIGLAAGSRLTFDSLGLVGYLPANAETVGSGLETLARFLHVNNNAAVPYLVGEDGLAALGCEPFGPGYWGIGQLMFGALAILTNALRTICGRDFRLRAVTFAYGAPADQHAFRRFFRAPVSFDDARSGICFDRARLAGPISAADPTRRRLIERQLRLLKPARDRPTTADHVQHVVRALLLAGSVTEEQTAPTEAPIDGQ